MPTYRLVVQRHDRLLGHFDADLPWAAEAIAEIAGRFSAAEGYVLQLLVAEHQRRLLESSPDGLRVLGREPLFVAQCLTRVGIPARTAPTPCAGELARELR
ncbi:MAG: hypothetical protein GAK45_00213 [Pseudomonas citronellolis]|nr:MAG: hypothetical protein GAK45_00213 [Pseudomonas citronellolis]